MTRVAEIFETLEYGPAPESDAAAKAWLAAHAQGFGVFIDGAWSAPLAGTSFEAFNPATGEALGRLAEAGPEDVTRAVEAAAKAFPGWAARSGHERARVLYALARAIQKSSRVLAVLETLDNGKPIRETRDIDVPLAARHFYHHAGWAQILEREAPGQRPIGVVGQIIPWNFPLLMLAWKLAPALACGNTVVLKPAEDTSLTALYFAELCQECGVPPGVVNIVTGPGAVGEALVDHPDVRKIAFTGSTEVGRRIRARTAGTGKRLSLELGGKSPFIVLEDADLDSAVEGLVDGIWFNQGEVCCAGSRLLVEEGVAERLLAKTRERLGRLRLGDPLDKAVDMGSLASPAQKARVTRLVDQAVAEGAKAWRPELDLPEQGSFYPPTLLTELGTANVGWREEIFGPVLAVMTFRTLTEAVQLANNSRYGLAASIWSNDINRALELAAEVKAGVVWVNCANQFDAACPFGGYRESGFGREGGREGLREYLCDGPASAPAKTMAKTSAPPPVVTAEVASLQSAPVDQTPKHYIGGRQARPDGGETRLVLDAAGRPCGRVPVGNRKDIRDAVEAAAGATTWTRASAHARAQVLYFIAENLDARAEAFAGRIVTLAGAGVEAARAEVQRSVERLFAYAAWADKFEGRVHAPPGRRLALSVREPLEVVGVACPDQHPLLGLISLMAPIIAMGGRVVAVPSERQPLIAADFYQVLETSDVPAGVVNLVIGARDALSAVLADHDGVDALWYFGSSEGSAMVEAKSVGNLKRTWVNGGAARDWMSLSCEGESFLREAVQVKTIWIPYGG